MTTIAIIGTGRMGTGLGRGWAKAGHTVIFGSRDPAANADIIATLHGARVTTVEEALTSAEVIVITLPFVHVEGFARDNAAHLRSKVVIDISNPFDNLPDNRIAGAEITANAIGAGARVVAAFKANFHTTLDQPQDPASGLTRDVQYAGDDEAAKTVVAGLITDLGFEPLDCGALKNARILDGMVPLIIELDGRYANANRSSSWKLLKS